MNELQTSIILVDDDSALRRATRQTLELANYHVIDFDNARAALDVIDCHFDGVVISDIMMPNIDGREFFARLQSIDPDLPVILITGHGDVPMAVEALQNGAYDFIAKPFPAERLLHSIKRAAETRRLTLENRRLRQASESAEAGSPLLGQTPAIINLRRILHDLADTNVDVLIAGETGSGKEVVAQLLHQWGRRKNGNFVALNCGALPETMFESELFGHEAGAFTGAAKKRIGRIEHSSGGTLFLDEIESMPLAIQVKFLRVLEMRAIEPLGNNEIRPLDLRVVAAAKADLGDPAQRGNFRDDLFYRLNVVTVTIPPLRERRDDIPLLFGHFLGKAAEKFQREPPAIDSSVHRHLMRHDWPGNVRELLHFAERVVLGVASFDKQTTMSNDEDMPLPLRVERYEEMLIRETLATHNDNAQATIAALGIPRKTFYDKLKRYGIKRGPH